VGALWFYAIFLLDLMGTMWKVIINFFDHLEDKVRARLSRHPVIYTLIGGVAIVLFWRGVDQTADMFFPFLNGPVSLFVSVTTLMLTGLFVSFFIGDTIIISGLKGEKKIVERTEQEIESELRMETVTLRGLKVELDKIEKDISDIKKSIEE